MGTEDNVSCRFQVNRKIELYCAVPHPVQTLSYEQESTTRTLLSRNPLDPLTLEYKKKIIA